MARILADLDDIQTYLGEDKLAVTDAETSRQQVEAQRIVVSQLAGVVPQADIASWDDPAATPPIIRSIAGELIAAYVYRNRYYEEADGDVRYAQMLYNEAMARLLQVRLGQLPIVDVNGVPLEIDVLAFANTDFYPNDTAPGPYFTVEKVLS